MGERTTVPLPFAQGYKQQESSEWTDPSSGASNIINRNFKKKGSAERRFGMGLISTGSQVAPGGARQVVGGQPLLANLSQGIRAVSWSKGALGAAGLDTSGNAGLWTALDVPPATNQNILPIGPLPNPYVTRRGVPSGQPSGALIGSTPTIVDVPTGTTFNRFIFYASQGATWFTVINADTGDTLVTPAQMIQQEAASIWAIFLPGAPAASCVAVMIQVTGSPSQLYGFTFTSTGGFIGQSMGPQSSYIADIMPFANDPQFGFIVLTQQTSGSYFVQFTYYKPGWVVVSTNSLESLFGNVSNTTALVIANYGAGEQLVFVYPYFSTPNYELRYSAVSGAPGYAFTSVVAGQVLKGPSTIQSFASGLCRMSAGTFFASYWFLNQPSGNANAGTMPVTTYGILRPGTSFTIEAFGQLPGYWPVSKAFTVGSGTSVYQATCTQLGYNNNLLTGGSSQVTSEQCTMYLMSYQNIGVAQYPVPVATVAPRQVDPTFADTVGMQSLPSMSQTAPGSLRFAVGVKTLATTSPGVGQGFGPAWVTDFFFDPGHQSLLYNSFDIAGALHLAGGVPMVCDGLNTFEHGFFTYPEFLFVPAPSAGSSNVLTGVYGWAVCYTRTDSSGHIARSAPDIYANNSTNWSPGSTAAPQLFINALGTSYFDYQNPGQTQIEIYRTLSGGSTYYLVTKIPGSQLVAGVAGYTDTVPDTAIQNSTVLYTTGDILDGVNPPSATCSTIHNNRLWIVDETQTTIWFTTAFVEGEEPRFNEALTLVIGQGGPITAIYSLDDKLIIGQAGGLWVVYGDGPEENGTGSSLTVPQFIASDAGPLDWRAGQVFPGGILFRSETGIMLCDRSLNVSWVGDDVVDMLASYPNIISSCIVPTATQVRFVCANTAMTATVVLCYDYLVDKWLQHTYPSQAAPVADVTIATGTASHAAAYASVTTDGALWLEHVATDTPSSGGGYPWLDDDTSGGKHFITAPVTTAWVKVQGVQGYQRACFTQLYFKDNDDCGLTISFAIDYNTSVVQTNFWNSAEVDSLPRSMLQLHVAGMYNRTAAIQVTFSDSQGTNMVTGKGATFVEANIELEALESNYRQVPVGGRG
jgi:hypothetical protein